MRALHKFYCLGLRSGFFRYFSISQFILFFFSLYFSSTAKEKRTKNMGNSGSINNITTQSDEQQIHQQSWTKITNPRNDGIKVLPRDGLIGARLRSTDNGNILHAGGTLTGQKKQQQPQIQRSKSITEQNFKNHSNLISRSQTQLEIIPRPDGLNKYKNSNLILMKKIGSVPDLSNELDEKRVYIKKYQAPQLPLQQQQKLTVDYDPCRFGWKTKASSPVLDLHQPRKQRLFKTRVETTKKPIHVRKLSSDEDRLSDSVKKTKTFFQIPQFRREKSFDVSLLSKSKVVKPPSPPQQQIEIFETTKSLKKIKENSKNQQNCFQQELLAATKKRIIEPKQKVLITEKITEQLPKTFYFGMNENQENEIYQNSMNRTQLDEIDKFAESLLNKSRKKAESSESALSSDCDDIPVSTLILINENSGISLQLRPTLPKKQFDVPRFSPAAAWRQLSTTTTAATDEQSRDYENDFITPAWDETNSSEIRIERIIRRPPVLPDNKSGDSGISGDAGLPERQDSPQPNKSSADDLLLKDCENYLSAWTPQLVLGDDDDESVSEQYQPIKTSNNGHIFSLSLPREHLLTQLNQKPEKSFNSLKKLKLTVSGAFGQTTTTTTTKPIDESIRNDNWFLSRSAPNSIDNVPAINNSTSTDDEIKPQTYELQQNLIIKPNSFNYLKTGHHIMYLPNHTLDETSDYKLNDEKIEENQKIYIKRGRENLQDLPSSPKVFFKKNYF